MSTTQHLDFIKKYLSEDLWDKAEQYDIPLSFIQNKNELIESILKSKTLNTPQKKQEWFNLFEKMNETQLQKLNTILINEKAKNLSQQKQDFIQNIADTLV